MKNLSDENTRYIQLLIVISFIIFVVIAVFIGTFRESVHAGVVILLMGLTFFLPASSFFLLFEIKFSEDGILVFNLFSKIEYTRDDLFEIHPTFLPFIYKILFQNKKGFFFMVPDRYIFRMLTVNSTVIVKEMEESIFSAWSKSSKK